MTEDVFNQKDSGETRRDVENYLSELVGEDKKFKSPEDLAKGKWEADNYIGTLESKLDELRKELEKRETADEIADRLQQQFSNREASSRETHQTPSENARTDDQKNFEGLSREELVKLLDQRLEEREVVSKAQRNRAEVSKTLNEKIGATANKWLADRANDLGVTVQYLQQQAEVSPKAFYNLVGLNQQQGNVGFNPPSSSLNSGARLDSGTQVRNNAFYEKLFKENPKLRFDAKTTVQMHKDATRMGEAFFKN